LIGEEWSNFDRFVGENPEILLPANLDIEVENVQEGGVDEKMLEKELHTPEESIKDSDPSLKWSEVVRRGKTKSRNEKKLVAMKGVFWNIRGLNKSSRLQTVADLISLNRLDFLGLQETKKEVINDNFLKAMSKDFWWNFIPARGAARGSLWGLEILFVILLLGMPLNIVSW
jgi:hypothetical protein